MAARMISLQGVANPEASLCCSSFEGHVWVYIMSTVYLILPSPVLASFYSLHPSIHPSIRSVSIYCRFPSLGCQPAFVSPSTAPRSAFLPPFSLHSLCLSVSLSHALFSLLLFQVFVSNLSY